MGRQGWGVSGTLQKRTIPTPHLVTRERVQIRARAGVARQAAVIDDCGSTEVWTGVTWTWTWTGSHYFVRGSEPGIGNVCQKHQTLFLDLHLDLHLPHCFCAAAAFGHHSPDWWQQEVGIMILILESESSVPSSFSPLASEVMRSESAATRLRIVIGTLHPTTATDYDGLHVIFMPSCRKTHGLREMKLSA